LTPDPLFVKFYYSHPPASERLSRMGFGNRNMSPKGVLA
jgi:STE24 endopeptidase